MSQAHASIHARLDGNPYQVALSDGTHDWLADEPASLGGADSGPTPHHLLLSALGACTAITVTMYARRKGWPLAGIHVDVQIVDEHLAPPTTLQLSRDIRLDGELSPEQRARLLEVANACPLHKLLSGEIRISSQLAETA